MKGGDGGEGEGLVSGDGGGETTEVRARQSVREWLRGCSGVTRWGGEVWLTY